MSATVSAALMILCLALSVRAETTLTVYAERPDTLGLVSSQSMQQELQRLVAPGVVWIWKDSGIDAKGANWIAVGSFDGVCSARNLPDRSLDGHGNVLAHTAVANGRVLPFFRVDCTSVLRILAPALRPLDETSREELLGRALGRVIAHEIYHVMARTTEHHATGIGKAFFALADLTGEGVAFEHGAVAQGTFTPERETSDSR
jgi:hypothetical protein